jgi:prepilin-type N-terminal cleavage/methylation domain-containing protein
MKKTARYKRYNGFSLIEISIVLLIISSMIGGGLMFFNEYRAKNKRQETFQKMHTIVAAIKNFSQTYKRLPCPADINATSSVNGWSTYGVSLSANDCANNPTYVRDNVITTSGMVPFKSLGLSEDYAIDGWGNRFRFVIGTGNARENVLAQEGGSGSEFTFANFAFTADTGRTDGLSPGKLFVLLSHGENGIGAIGARGQNSNYSLASVGNIDSTGYACAPSGSVAPLDRDIANAISANQTDDIGEIPTAYYYIGSPVIGFDDIVMGLRYEDLMSTGLGGSTGSSGKGTSGTTYSNLTFLGRCSDLANVTHVSTGTGIFFSRIISYDCNAGTIVLETPLPEGTRATKGSRDGVTCCYNPGIFYNQ